MGTVIRPELSEKNKYCIERHRYYELKHFCLQYPIWKHAYLSLDGLSKRPSDLRIFSKGGYSNPTERIALARAQYSIWMKLVEDAARDTDEIFGKYIFIGVTEGVSFEQIKARIDFPLRKDVYYELYRRFFWLLNDSRK